jgi:hypothetical protein
MFVIVNIINPNPVRPEPVEGCERFLVSMWSFPKYRNEFVAIIIQPTAITCSWITPSARNNALYQLRAYQHTPLAHGTIINGILFNPTALQKTIRHFIHTHGLEHAFVACSSRGSAIPELCIDLPTASPKHIDFPLQRLNKLIWDYQYLYPKDNHHYTFYVCGISRHVLAHYQLLACAASLNLVLFTTEYMALLTVYKHMYGPAFRHTQLARDMEQNHHQLLNVLTTDTLRRLLTIHPSLSLNLEAERPLLLTALGLFLAGTQQS